MKIAIIGTRGIPNNYGGFEQLAEYLSVGLTAKGHDIYVYSSHKHTFQEKTWKGVHIIHKYDPEKKVGTIGQFIYDFNCIVDARKRNFDVILNLGYTSSSVWIHFFPKQTKLITNMDGLEWKRTKYSKYVQFFLLYAEKLAVRMSDKLIADSLGIKEYISKKYKVHSDFIAYGADLFDVPDKKVLTHLGIDPYGYNMLIARMEPENNIELILDGMHKSISTRSFIVIGNAGNKFGSYLKDKYKNDKRIVFMGSIYDSTVINNLRYYSNIYFHGHSVGGTNPSLIEAMGSHCLIAAHDNIFNKSVLEQDAYYFSESEQVMALLNSNLEKLTIDNKFVSNNYEKVTTHYSWDRIVNQYEKVLTSE